MLKLKINTPEGVIYEWKVKEVVVPTEDGMIGILPGHIPLVSVVKPGILKFKPEEDLNKDEFIWEEDWLNITVWRWLIFIDWENVLLNVSKSIFKPEKSIEILENMKKELEEDIEKLKSKWEIEDIEKALLMLQTVEAEIKLWKKKGIL